MTYTVRFHLADITDQPKTEATLIPASYLDGLTIWPDHRRAIEAALS
ncbi:hypothetical protein HUO13_28625 [Saccharopolyspora erythraea]|nr:hypothetical protein [Saccharopolyspora erythraea]QUH04229.1 hypothetical protein HUO13_28625 [Saccharopolyspora erythraea]